MPRRHPPDFRLRAIAWHDARLAVGLDESDVLHRVQEEIIASFAGLALLIAIVLIGVWFGGRETVRATHTFPHSHDAAPGHGEFGLRATRLPWAAEFIPLAAALDDMADKSPAASTTAREQQPIAATSPTPMR